MKLIWTCISDNLSIVDWFNKLHYFLFLNPSSANLTERLITLKQFVSYCQGSVLLGLTILWGLHFCLIMQNVKPFVNFYFSQSFCLFASSPVIIIIIIIIHIIIFKNKIFIDFQWSINSRCLPWFSHAAIFWATGF